VTPVPRIEGTKRGRRRDDPNIKTGYLLGRIRGQAYIVPPFEAKRLKEEAWGTGERCGGRCNPAPEGLTERSRGDASPLGGAYYYCKKFATPREIFSASDGEPGSSGGLQ